MSVIDIKHNRISNWVRGGWRSTGKITSWIWKAALELPCFHEADG